MDKSIESVFSALDSVGQDLYASVMNEIIQDASEDATRPLRFTIHQLTVELDKERRKRTALTEQLRSAERLIDAVRVAAGDEPGPSSQLLFSVLQGHLADIRSRLNELVLSEKMSRRAALKQTLSAKELRSRAAANLVDWVKEGAR